MTVLSLQKTSKIYPKETKSRDEKSSISMSEPVVNRGFKSIFGVLKSFLLVGGDLV
jgi:hypothetical protein